MKPVREGGGGRKEPLCCPEETCPLTPNLEVTVTVAQDEGGLDHAAEWPSGSVQLQGPGNRPGLRILQVPSPLLLCARLGKHFQFCFLVCSKGNSTEVLRGAENGGRLPGVQQLVRKHSLQGWPEREGQSRESYF